MESASHGKHTVKHPSLPIERSGLPSDPEPGNANCWLFTKEEFLRAPNFTESKLSVSDESAYRRKAAAFIQICGKELGVMQSTIATACVMMHRFYTRHTFEDANLYEASAACLFLACKVNENVRKLKQIVVTVAKIACHQKLDATEPSKLFHKWRNVIMYHEEVVLEALCFDLTFELPYPFLLKYLDELEGGASAELKMMAWCVVNDSFHTSLCLRYEPAFVAAGCIVFAGMLMGFDPKQKASSWQSLLRVHESVLLAIGDELSALYETVLKDSTTMQTLMSLHANPPTNEDGEAKSKHAAKGIKEAVLNGQAYALTKKDQLSAAQKSKAASEPAKKPEIIKKPEPVKQPAAEFIKEKKEEVASKKRSREPTDEGDEEGEISG